MKKIWDVLNRSIFVGERYKANMRALAFASFASAFLGLVLIILNIISKNYPMLFPSALTFLAGSGCAFCVLVLKNREVAISIPTIFCATVFTVYAVTGTGQGSAIMWSLLLPIGMCYFVSVKYGIVLSFYYTVLYCVIFYSPYRDNITIFYTDSFMSRFPILFGMLSAFTSVAMYQYHKHALFEIDYTDRLSREVEHQTEVAEERARRIEQMSLQTMQTLANAIDAKDPYTKGHSTRVSAYSVKIAEALGWDKERVDNLRYSAMLHDIGKIGVPDSILNNPRKLTDVEYEIIKSHTTMGRDILIDRTMIEGAENVAGSHHERYDGDGYPLGLKGAEISEEARIVAVADAFDAMSSSRVYRKACNSKHIHRELIEGKGKQFDPEIVDIFLDLWDRGELDELMNEDAPEMEEAEDMEASSVLLQEVMETFVSQNAAEEIDVTTGIPGRNAGESALAQAMKEVIGCFVFFDVDNLKKINDTCGHEAGDRALRLMGDILMEHSEESPCCRLGGDEFLMFMKDVSMKEAESRVKSILNEYEEKKQEDVEISVASLSAGMVMCSPSDTYMEVYNKADKALYHVKQNGKDGYGFYHQNSENGTIEQVDVNRLVGGIRNSGNYEGAMDVEYREFTKLYEFITNLERRFSHPFKLIMISLKQVSGAGVGVEELEKAMYYMEQSIRQTIREVDIVTRYSRAQFLIILLGTDDKGVKMAVDRMFRGYYKMNGSGAFSPSYSIADREEVAKKKSSL